MKTARQAEREARELWRVCLVGGGADAARTRLVVDQVIASKRSGTLAVLKRLLRRVRLDAARHAATVATATPLDDEVRIEVVRTLERQHGRTIATTFLVDPALIGGMRVQVGSDLYDGSVKASLAALESRF